MSWSPHNSKNTCYYYSNCANNELILTARPRSELTFTTCFTPKPQSLLFQTPNPCYLTLHSHLLSEISLLVSSNTFHSTVIYFWFACFLGHEDLRPAYCIDQSGNTISGTLGRPRCPKFSLTQRLIHISFFNLRFGIALLSKKCNILVAYKVSMGEKKPERKFWW